MRILFFVLSIFLLSACSHQQFTSVIDHFKGSLSPDTLEEECDETFSYDNSGSPCNIYGWQLFVYQSLAQTQEAHDQTLLNLGNNPGDTYKRLILLSHHHEPLNVRIEATDALLNIAKANSNSFGHFFYIIATYNKQDLAHQKEAVYSQDKLKQKNTKLKRELNKTKAKIQAIMDIEKNLNTN